MTALSIGASSANSHVPAGAAALLLLALTSVHHAYGAAVYGTPWRLHIVYVAVPVAIAIAATLYAGWSRREARVGRAFTWIAAAIILAFPVATIGVFEGGYNHLFKTLVYFGLGEGPARAIFPAPTYEMPDDLVFEVTGIAQFPLAILTAILTVAMLRRPHR